MCNKKGYTFRLSTTLYLREKCYQQSGERSACWNDSADLKQPDTKPKSKVHRNAVELRAVPFVRGRHIMLLWGLGDVELDYSMALMLRRTLLDKLQTSSTCLRYCIM